MSTPHNRRLRIVSDGTANGTLIYDAAGDVVKFGATGVIRVEILPIEPNGAVRAVVTLDMVAVDVDVQATAA